MRLTASQQRAHDLMRAAPDGSISAASGVSRLTVEALARRGLAHVSCTMRERTVRRGSGGTQLRVYADWTAQLLPVAPDPAVIESLDLIAGSAQRTLRPSQHDQAAAYIARALPTLTPGNSPVKAPYSLAASYAHHLRMDDDTLLWAYARCRSRLPGRKPPGGPAPKGAPTDFWVMTERTPSGATGRELGRVPGTTQSAAALAANNLLDRRGGYDMHRLGTRELGGWRKDFRAGGTVLRLSARGNGMEQVTEVASGVVLASRHTPEDAEREARAEVASLTAALAAQG